MRKSQVFQKQCFPPVRPKHELFRRSGWRALERNVIWMEENYMSSLGTRDIGKWGQGFLWISPWPKESVSRYRISYHMSQKFSLPWHMECRGVRIEWKSGRQQNHTEYCCSPTQSSRNRPNAPIPGTVLPIQVWELDFFLYYNWKIFLKIIQSVDFAKREIPVNNVSRKTQKYDIHCLPSSFKIVI